MSEQRWTLYGLPMPGIEGPEPPKDGVEVMPVTEHEEAIDHHRRAQGIAEEAWSSAEDDLKRLRKMVAGAVELWDEAHREDNVIALGAAFVGLREALNTNSPASGQIGRDA